MAHRTAGVTTTQSRSPTASPATPLTRPDGLTGAPLPSQTAFAPTPAFDERRLDRGAGAFPPLTDPPVVSAADAHWLHPGSRVLGALQHGEARAYPLLIMQFHHVANDRLGGEPYLATF